MKWNASISRHVVNVFEFEDCSAIVILTTHICVECCCQKNWFGDLYCCQVHFGYVYSILFILCNTFVFELVYWVQYCWKVSYLSLQVLEDQFLILSNLIKWLLTKINGKKKCCAVFFDLKTWFEDYQGPLYLLSKWPRSYHVYYLFYGQFNFCHIV